MNREQQLTELDEFLDSIPKNTDVVLSDLKKTYKESEVFTTAKLTPLTRKVMERWYAKQERKRLGLLNRKRTRYRGRYHHARKAQTQKKRRERRWKEKPFECVIHMKGRWALDRKLWDQYVAPLWERYDSRDLKIKRRWGYGTAEKPYTIYDISIVHREKGAVFDGDSLRIYLLSAGNTC